MRADRQRSIIETHKYDETHRHCDPEPAAAKIRTAKTKKGARLLNLAPFEYGVDEGDRTLDNGSHNPVLYQLSYAHHIALTKKPNYFFVEPHPVFRPSSTLIGADEETRTLTPRGAGT